MPNLQDNFNNQPADNAGRSPQSIRKQGLRAQVHNNLADQNSLIKKDKKGNFYIQRQKIRSLPIPFLKPKSADITPNNDRGNKATQISHSPVPGAQVEPWIKYSLLVAAFFGSLVVLPPLALLTLPAFLLFQQAYCMAPRPQASYLFFSITCFLTIIPGAFAYYGLLSSWLLILEKIWVSLGNSEIITHRQLTFLLDLLRPLDFSSLAFCDFPSLKEICMDTPLVLIFAITPAYGMIVYFYLWHLPKANKKLLEAYLAKVREAENRLTKEKEIRSNSFLEQNQIILRAIAANELILLGEEVDRIWQFPQMSWAIVPKPENTQQYRTLTLQNLLYHVISCGATRAGKSVNLARPIIQFAIANRFGMLIIDPKGDLLTPEDSSFNFSVVEAEKDRSYRFCVIDDRVTLTTAARNFAEAVIDSDDSSPDSLFFIAWARRVLAAVMLAHRLIFDQWPELIKVLEYAADPVTIGSLVSKLKQIQYNPKLEVNLRQTALEVVLELKSPVNLVPGRSKTNPFETVANSIQAMATDKYANCLTTNSTCGVTIRQILDERLTARFSYNLSEGEVSRQLNRVVVRQFTTIALEPAEKQEKPRFLLVDEASEVICEALATLVTKGAGRQAGAILLFQNLSQIRKSKLVHDIFANCRTKLVLTGTSGETAELFSELSGYCSLPMLTSNQSSSKGYTTGSARSNGNSQGQNLISNKFGPGTTRSQSYQVSFSDSTSRSTGQSQGRGRIFVERLRWNTSEIMNLPRFYALAWLYDGTGDVKMHLLKFISPDERARLTIKVKVPQPKAGPLQTLSSPRQAVTFVEEQPEEKGQADELKKILAVEVDKQPPEIKPEKPVKRKRNRNSRQKRGPNLPQNQAPAPDTGKVIFPAGTSATGVTEKDNLLRKTSKDHEC